MVKKPMIAIVTVLLLGGCAPAPISSDVATPCEPRATIYDLELDGKKLSVPFPVSELEGTGYTMTGDPLEKVVRGVDNIVYYTDEDDGMIVANLGTLDDECSVNEAVVIDILADKGNTDTSRLRVFGGIGFDSTKEEVEKVFGEPVMTDSDLAMYSLTQEGAYMDGVYVAMDGDEIFRVEVLRTQDYIDWDMSELEEFESESASE